MGNKSNLGKQDILGIISVLAVNLVVVLALVMTDKTGTRSNIEVEKNTSAEVTTTTTTAMAEIKPADQPEKSSSTEKTTTAKPKVTTTSKAAKSSSDSLSAGEYWCMGKNDTCKNKTYSPTDLYCHSCDPDDNNIEGDQRTTDGKVGDNNGNGKIDDNDWEIEWNDYLNEKYDEYGY